MYHFVLLASVLFIVENFKGFDLEVDSWDLVHYNLKSHVVCHRPESDFQEY